MNSNADTTAQKYWRIFCAIELPESLRSEVATHIAKLQAVKPKVASWTRTENLHLTLKFFGNTDINRVDAISQATALAVTGLKQFSIHVGKTGVFPKPSFARVMWIGVGDPSGSLAELQSKLENQSEAMGFAKEDRAFHPHLTIARIRDPRTAREVIEFHLKADFAEVTIPVNEIVVMRSELMKDGSRYTPLSRHELQL